MKRILAVTGSRAEYGILRHFLQKLDALGDCKVELVVTGTHLEEKYGYTIREIEEDKVFIVKRIPLDLRDTKKITLAKALSKLTQELAELFEEQRYDVVIILGDRYEMLPVSNVALIYNIPVCHIHGGEKTLGNFDEAIRHAITKMSHLHLVSTEEFKNRVLQLGEEEDKVFHIGSMGVENVRNQRFFSREELEAQLQISLEESYFVVLFHPVTLEENTAKEQMKTVIKALDATKKQLIFIGSNADTDSDEIMEVIKHYVSQRENAKLCLSLPTVTYHSLVKYSKGLIGNSSSGLIEVPSLKVPTLNIGNRQKGRLSGPSVIHVSNELEEMAEGLKKLEEVSDFTNPYEKEGSAEAGIAILQEFLKEASTIKVFRDLK